MESIEILPIPEKEPATLLVSLFNIPALWCGASERKECAYSCRVSKNLVMG